MSVAGSSFTNALSVPEFSQGEISQFQEAGRNLQTQELENAKQSANALDTIRFSGIGHDQQQLISDVSVLSRHLQQGDLGGAGAAYQAIQKYKQNQGKAAAKSQSSQTPPAGVKVGDGRIQDSPKSDTKGNSAKPEAASTPMASQRGIDAQG